MSERVCVFLKIYFTMVFNCGLFRGYDLVLGSWLEMGFGWLKDKEWGKALNRDG